jgi:hypothetical protein
MARLAKVKYHVLRDTKQSTVIDDLALFTPERNADVFENRIAFTCLLTHPDGKVYCGITAMNADIFHRFDPATETFESLGYQSVSEPFEVKIHRSLELASDGTIYGASACLYSIDQRLQTTGGAIFKFHPRDGKIRKLAVPCPRDYIQTITLDERRGLIYGMTCPVLKFFVYDLKTGKVEDNDYLGSITHLGALDDAGCYWGTWDPVKHYLFKYDPAVRKIVYFHHSIPEGAKHSSIMYPGAGPVDTMINGGDGYLYIGTCGGSLVRLDPRTAEATYLGRPACTRRMPGLHLWHDSLLIGAGGDEEGGYVFTYDRKTGAVQNLGPIVAADGKKLYRVHDLCITADGRKAFVAETDVPNRSGYLWQVDLEF